MRSWPNRPFAPRRLPVHYAWIILVLGSVGVVITIPGQTVGVSVFTDFLIRDLEVTRVRLSLAYLLGTLTGAFLLAPAGRLYDRFGARALGAVAALCLGALLLMLSGVDSVVERTAVLLSRVPKELIAFAAMSVGFFLLRFLAQGVLNLVCRNMVMKWFRGRRGMTNGILGVSVALTFSYSPKLLNTLIESFGWRGTWFRLGLIIGVGFVILFSLLARDNPASCGLEPDGRRAGAAQGAAGAAAGVGVAERAAHRGGARAGTGRSKRGWTRPPAHPDRDFTAGQARRTYAFWMFTMTLFTAGLYYTAFTFHVVSIFDNAGMSRQQAVSIFFPASVISVALNFVFSWASDYVKLKYILILQIVGLLLSIFSFIHLRPGVFFVLLIIGNGLNGGTFGLNSTVTWPRFFGLTHLGAVSGFAMSWIIAGSALGPFLFSLSLSYTGSYAGAGYLCLAVMAVLLILSLRADRPDHPGEERRG